MLSLTSGLFILCSTSEAANFDHSYAKWDKVLKTFVSVKTDGNSSQVKYGELAGKRTELDAYVTDVEGVSKAEYDKWTDLQKQAFLLNAYNALAIKLILDNKTPKSIKDIGGIFWSPWNKKFFKLFGSESSLDGIAHGLLRAQFNNCRFNFALNMAAVGSPMLRNEPYLAEKLNEQLEDAARRFLSDSTAIRSKRSRTLYKFRNCSIGPPKILKETPAAAARQKRSSRVFSPMPANRSRQPHI